MNFSDCFVPAQHHLQCLSWHWALQAAGFFIAKFLAHQLLQNATHFGEPANALVCAAATSIATISVTIHNSARQLLILHPHCGPSRMLQYTTARTVRRTPILAGRDRQ